jgi:hypothetical protein
MKQNNELMIHRMSSELEKQSLDPNYTDSMIKHSMQLSDGSFRKFKKLAKLELEKRIEIRKEAIHKVIEEETIEAVRSGLRTDLEIEVQLCKIAFGEMDVYESTSTPEGFIDFKRKPSPQEMIQAIKEIWKKRGTYAAEKIDANINEFKITLNL